MKFTRFFNILLLTGLCLSATSCFDDDDSPSDYSAWQKSNDEFVENALKKTNDDGTPYYEKFVPDWAPSSFVLAHWHNDQSKNSSELVPMNTSTVDMIYDAKDIEGKSIDNSFSLRQYGDSIYRTQPYSMITGVRLMLTKMHVGDSVSLVIPADAAYGSKQNGTVKPFTTLLFELKLKGIPYYEIRQ